MPCIPAADMAGSMMALSGILMALLRREKTGRGDYVDISMQDSIVSWLVNVISPVFAEKRNLVPADERSLGGNAFYGIYACADGRHLTLGGAEIKFVKALLEELGRPDLIDLCKLPPGRGQDPVREFLTATFATQPLAHWEAVLARLGICWAPVKGIKEALDTEHILARGMKQEFPGGDLHLGIPIRYSEEPGRIQPQPPGLGEHTEQVLREAGCTPQQVAAVLAGAGR